MVMIENKMKVNEICNKHSIFMLEKANFIKINIFIFWTSDPKIRHLVDSKLLKVGSFMPYFLLLPSMISHFSPLDNIKFSF